MFWTQEFFIEQVVLLAVGVGWGVLGYTSTEKFRRENGVTPWGWPSVIWAFAWFVSIVVGAVLWTIAVNRTRKHLAAPRSALVPAPAVGVGAPGGYDPYAPPVWAEHGAAPVAPAALAAGGLTQGSTPDGIDAVEHRRVDGAGGPGGRRAAQVAVTALAIFALLVGGLVVLRQRSSAHLQLQMPATLGGLLTATDPALQALRSTTQGQIATSANGPRTAVGTYGTVGGSYAMLELFRGVTSASDMANLSADIQSSLPADATLSAATQVGNSQCVAILRSGNATPIASVCARTSAAANLTVLVLLVRGDVTQASPMVDEAWAAQP